MSDAICNYCRSTLKASRITPVVVEANLVGAIDMTLSEGIGTEWVFGCSVDPTHEIDLSTKDAAFLSAALNHRFRMLLENIKPEDED